MTSKNSLCIKCKNLETYHSLCTPAGGKEALLISSCLYGGVNAGNRKQCKSFEPTEQEKITERLNIFKEFEK